jgi:hypothetical protein
MYPKEDLRDVNVGSFLEYRTWHASRVVLASLLIVASGVWVGAAMIRSLSRRSEDRAQTRKADYFDENL